MLIFSLRDPCSRALKQRWKSLCIADTQSPNQNSIKHSKAQMALMAAAILLALLQLHILVSVLQQPSVDLNYAQYAGTTLSSGISQFLGLRFAKAPIGNLRFAAPQPPDPISGLTQATQVSTAF